MKFIHWMLDHPVTVTMFYVALFIIGLISFHLIPLELSPHIELPKLTIQTYWPNTSAITIESRATALIESEVQRIKGIKNIRSWTGEGNSTVNIEFEKNTNLDLAELELNERISQLHTKLPQGVSWPLVKRSVPNEMRSFQGFMSYKIIADLTASEIRKFAEENLILPLSSVRGVDKVNIWGGEEKILEIRLKPNVLQKYEIEPGSIRKQLSYASQLVTITNKTIGSINLRISSEFNKIVEIRNLPVKKLKNGRIIKLNDIATTHFNYQQPQNIQRINGKSIITINIDKQPDLDLINTAARVKERVEKLKKILPTGMELLLDDDKSKGLLSELDKLSSRSILSILFIMALLVIVYKKIRTALIIISSIIFAIIGAIALFYLSGNTINILILAGFTLGFGLLVDNAIVVYDNIQRRFNTTALPESKKEVVAKAVVEMVQPLMASNLTTLGAFVPVFFLSQELQISFKSFGLTLGITLMLSLLVSFTLIPTLFFQWFQESNNSLYQKDNNIIERGYQFMLQICMRHKKTSIVIIIWLFGFPIWLLPDKVETEIKKQIEKFDNKDVANRLQYESLILNSLNNRVNNVSSQSEKIKEQFNQKMVHDVPFWKKIYNDSWGNLYFTKNIKPILFSLLGGSSYLFFDQVPKGKMFKTFDKTSIDISIALPPNIHLKRINLLCSEFENRLLKYSNRLERIRTNISYPGTANIRIDVKDKYQLSEFPFNLYKKIALYSNNISGVNLFVSGYGPGFMRTLADEKMNIGFEVSGYNYNKVNEIANVLAERLQKNNRIKNISIDRNSLRGLKQKQYEYTYKPEIILLSSLLLDPQLVVNHFRLKFASEYSFKTKLDGKSIFTEINEEKINSKQILNLKNNIIGNTRKTRINNIAQFKQKTAQPIIAKENQSYSRLVTYSFIGSHKIAKKHLDRFLDGFTLPYGFNISKNLYNWNKSESTQLKWVFLFSLLIIWMISASLFESFKKPFIILSSIPLSTVGFFLSFYAFNAYFDIGGLISGLIVMGIVVNNAIILLKHIITQLKEQKSYTTWQTIKAASERLRPILITTTSTIVGISPFVLFEAQSSIWYSLGVGVIGGLFSSTVLILIIIPISIDLFNNKFQTSSR